MKKLICPICGDSFEPKNNKHKYDKRKCFKLAYDRKHRKKESEEDEKPKFICQYCKEVIQLKFYPRRDAIKWNKFVCPCCKEKRRQ